MLASRRLVVPIGLIGSLAGCVFMAAHVPGGRALAAASALGMIAVLWRRGPGD